MWYWCSHEVAATGWSVCRDSVLRVCLCKGLKDNQSKGPTVLYWWALVQSPPSPLVSWAEGRRRHMLMRCEDSGPAAVSASRSCCWIHLVHTCLNQWTAGMSGDGGGVCHRPCGQAVMHCGPVSQPQIESLFSTEENTICCEVLCSSFRRKTQQPQKHQFTWGETASTKPSDWSFLKRSLQTSSLSLVVIGGLVPQHFAAVSSHPSFVSFLQCKSLTVFLGIQIGSYPRHLRTSAAITAG